MYMFKYFGFRDNLGGRVKVMVSGGALLPPYLEKFYSMTGLQVINESLCNMKFKVIYLKFDVHFYIITLFFYMYILNILNVY